MLLGVWKYDCNVFRKFALRASEHIVLSGRWLQLFDFTVLGLGLRHEDFGP